MGSKEKDAGLTNSPEVEHRLGELDGNDAQAETRAAIEEAVEEAKVQAEADADRALALAAPVQKVTDANEAAALLSLTGQRPVRDVSDAPAPGRLGPHSDDNPLTESEAQAIADNTGASEAAAAENADDKKATSKDKG